MFLNVFTHEYFWLSFLPITLLGAGFWLLYFDREDDIKEPIILLLLALLSGISSAVLCSFFGTWIGLQNMFEKVACEEIFKVLFAVLVMEILKKRFKSISQGIMYGFAVGIGFSMAENTLYLMSAYNSAGFADSFWLTFQGRFWSSSLLHGVTTAFFGLFYAGTYLSKTLGKAKNESPLRTFFVPPRLSQIWYILSFHVTRNHLIFRQQETTSMANHEARTVIAEGLWLAIIIHFTFNTALYYSRPIMAFAIAFVLMVFLGRFGTKK